MRLARRDRSDHGWPMMSANSHLHFDTRRRPACTVLAAAAASAGMTRLADRCIRRLLPSTWTARLQRTNFAGAPVSLREGPAVVVGVATGALVAGRPGLAVTALAAGTVGLVDDLKGNAQAKGLAGHMRALARGQVTTGTLKVAGIGATAAIATWSGRPRLRWVSDTVTVAGAANLANLLDLRPGRALKVLLAVSLPLAADLGSASDVHAAAAVPAAAAAVAGAAAAALRADLSGATMLGDTGANALGAVVGCSLVGLRSPWARAVATTTVVVLTFASERVSFSSVIAGNRILRALDQWGRA